MKRTTFLLALLVASAISTVAMAATNYYILVGGVWVTSDNASNVTSEYIKSGTVSYHASSNTLFLRDVVIDCENKPATSGINVQPNAPYNFKIVLEGKNIIRNTNATPIQFHKSKKAESDTYGDFHIYGTGSLDVENGIIGCYDDVVLDLGEYYPFDYYEGNWKPTSGPTINALAIRGNNNENNMLRIGACCTTLTGYTYYSGGQRKGVCVDGFSYVAQALPDCGIYLPPGNGDKISYDTTNMYIPDADGNCLGTTVYLGWKRYGLRVSGVEVTAHNREKFVIESDRYNCEFSYDPDKKTLYMNSGYQIHTTDEPVIENTGSDLTVQFKQGDERVITFESTNAACISSTQNISFVSEANTQILLILQGTYALKMEETGKTALFSKLELLSPRGNIDMADGQLGFSNCDEVRLETSKYNVQGVATLSLTGMEIKTKGVFYNPSTQKFCSDTPDKEYTGYAVIINRVNEYYGIRVGGHELNNINANNFYYSNVQGTLTYDNDAKLLTLENLTVDAGEGNIINFSSKAPESVHIKLVGDNTMSNAAGYVGVCLRNNPIIEGTGTLTLNKDIECFDGSNLTINDACTINATRLIGRDYNGGDLNIGNATINLTGETNYRTVYGFSNIFYNEDGYSFATTPNAAYYDKTDKVLKKFDGTAITSTVKFEPVYQYSVILNGIYVHDKNCDDILRDVPHTGHLSYEPDSHVLKMEDLSFECDLAHNDNTFTTLILYKDITIQLTGENEIKNLNNISIWNFGENKEVNFVGPGSLQTDGVIWLVLWNSPGTVIQQISIKDCSLKAAAIVVDKEGTYNNTSLTISNANVQLEGNYNSDDTPYTAISGFNKFTLEDAEFVPSGTSIYSALYYDPQVGFRCMRSYFGDRYYGAVEIRSTHVTVEDITNLIDRYLNSDGEITLEDITNLIDRYLNADSPEESRAVDLGLSVKWATMNIGANSPEEFGDYFAWGETIPKDYYGFETYKWCEGNLDTMTKYCTQIGEGTVDNKTVLDLRDDAARFNWGIAWRMPTYEECDELITKCTWEQATLNGVYGQKVTGPNGNSIFLPAADYWFEDESPSRSKYGLYWSSSLGTNYNFNGSCMSFDSDPAYMKGYINRCCGLSVRAVCP